MAPHDRDRSQAVDRSAMDRYLDRRSQRPVLATLIPQPDPIAAFEARPGGLDRDPPSGTTALDLHEDTRGACGRSIGNLDLARGHEVTTQ